MIYPRKNESDWFMGGGRQTVLPSASPLREGSPGKLGSEDLIFRQNRGFGQIWSFFSHFGGVREGLKIGQFDQFSWNSR